MPRQSKAMKELADAMALFQAAAAEEGIDLGDTSALVEMKHVEAETKQDTLREADGVLISLTYPTRLAPKKCKACGEVFMTNYMGVGCCSTACRRAWFKESVGIEWDFSRKPVWGDYEPPLVISAAAVDKLEVWATKFLADIESIRTAIQENPPGRNRLHLPLGLEPEEPELVAEPETSSAQTPPTLPQPELREPPANLLETLDTPVDLDFDF